MDSEGSLFMFDGPRGVENINNKKLNEMLFLSPEGTNERILMEKFYDVNYVN